VAKVCLWLTKFIVSIKKKHTFDKSARHNETIARTNKSIGVIHMKKFKKFIFIGAVVLIIAATSVTALAAAYGTPAEIVAGLTGQTADSVLAAKTESGSTYGAIANEAGVLAEFKTQMLELKKEALAERVAAGRMTQEQADAILAQMEANMANCDGTGSGRGACTGTGAGFGGMGGMGKAGGMGKGMGGMGICSGVGA
jgi:hypothetical protein